MSGKNHNIGTILLDKIIEKDVEMKDESSSVHMELGNQSSILTSYGKKMLETMESNNYPCQSSFEIQDARFD